MYDIPRAIVKSFLRSVFPQSILSAAGARLRPRLPCWFGSPETSLVRVSRRAPWCFDELVIQILYSTPLEPESLAIDGRSLAQRGTLHQRVLYRSLATRGEAAGSTHSESVWRPWDLVWRPPTIWVRSRGFRKGSHNGAGLGSHYLSAGPKPVFFREYAGGYRCAATVCTTRFQGSATPFDLGRGSGPDEEHVRGRNRME